MFDEVIKIIEEEGLDVESLFLAAFERLCDDQTSDSDSKSQITDKKSKSPSNSHPHHSPESAHTRDFGVEDESIQ